LQFDFVQKVVLKCNLNKIYRLFEGPLHGVEGLSLWPRGKDMAGFRLVLATPFLSPRSGLPGFLL